MLERKLIPKKQGDIGNPVVQWLIKWIDLTHFSYLGRFFIYQKYCPKISALRISLLNKGKLLEITLNLK